MIYCTLLTYNISARTAQITPFLRLRLFVMPTGSQLSHLLATAVVQLNNWVMHPVEYIVTTLNIFCVCEPPEDGRQTGPKHVV
jgi:hypothetical protein